VNRAMLATKIKCQINKATIEINHLLFPTPISQKLQGMRWGGADDRRSRGVEFCSKTSPPHTHTPQYILLLRQYVSTASTKTFQRTAVTTHGDWRGVVANDGRYPRRGTAGLERSCQLLLFSSLTLIKIMGKII
jgi:hypothetical protein